MNEPRTNRRCGGRCRRLAVIVPWVSALGSLTPAAAGYTVGIDFPTGPLWWWASDPFHEVTTNLSSYTVTAAGSPFSANGALAGWSEQDVRLAIVDSVQTVFRSAEIQISGRMLNLKIVQGSISASAGTVHLVADDLLDGTSAGLARYNGAIDRVDLSHGPPYTNVVSVTLADTVSGMGVTFNTSSEVINSISGTTAHEIAHTFGVKNHVPGTPVNGVYPIMASGASQPPLPISARLTERAFLDIPGTEDDGRSVPEVLVATLGTVAVTDFNFDSVTDVSDYNTVLWGLGRTGIGVRAGDANNDRVSDVSDYNMVLAALGTAHDEVMGNIIPQFRYNPANGKMYVNADTITGEYNGLNSMLIEGPAALSTDSEVNSLNTDDAVEWQGGNWVQDWFNGKEQWARVGGDRLQTNGGELLIATYAPGLTEASFGQVEYSYSTGPSDQTGFTNVMIPEPSTMSLLVLGGLGLIARRRRRT